MDCSKLSPKVMAVYNEVTGRSDILNHIGVKLDLLEPDHAILSIPVTERIGNPYGFVHGGILTTLADTASGICAMTDGRKVVTENCSFYFIGNTNHGRVRADARAVKRGRKVVLVSVELKDDDDKLLARGTFSMFSITQPVE